MTVQKLPNMLRRVRLVANILTWPNFARLLDLNSEIKLICGRGLGSDSHSIFLKS